MKMPTTTEITIYLRLMRTRMYSRSVDSCDGNALYSAEVIGLRNSAGSPGCRSRNPALLRESLFRGTRGPNDIVTPYSLRCHNLGAAACRTCRIGLRSGLK